MQDIKKFARKKLHAVASPRKIEPLPGLPKTKRGKIMRRLLKARELGLPEGDTSQCYSLNQSRVSGDSSMIFSLAPR
jgi:acyl-coenzyme A synthetase/AMP-(fatty) acid ligase